MNWLKTIIRRWLGIDSIAISETSSSLSVQEETKTEFSSEGKKEKVKEIPRVFKYYDRAVNIFMNPDARSTYYFEDVHIRKCIESRSIYYSYSGIKNCIIDSVYVSLSYKKEYEIAEYNNLYLSIDSDMDESKQEAKWEYFLEQIRLAALKIKAS